MSVFLTSAAMFPNRSENSSSHRKLPGCGLPHDVVAVANVCPVRAGMKVNQGEAP